LNWCYRREYIDQNPLSRLRPPPGSQARDRVLSDAELVRVWNASSEGLFGAYMRVLILTAQRKGQWLRYRPEFVEGDTIVFPASVMKGKKVLDTDHSAHCRNYRRPTIYRLQRGSLQTRAASRVPNLGLDASRPSQNSSNANGGARHLPSRD